MLNLDQDTFITNYVTTFLSTHAADRHSRLGNDGAEKYQPPVTEAVLYARRAWYSLLEQFGPPKPWR